MKLKRQNIVSCPGKLSKLNCSNVKGPRMQFAIVHEIPGVQGRLRARAASGFSLSAARYMAERLEQTPGLADIRINALTGSVLLRYGDAAARRAALEILGCFRQEMSQRPPAVPLERGGGRQDLSGSSTPPRSANPQAGLAAARHPILRPLLTYAVKVVAAALLAAPFLLKGLKALCRGQLNRDVLEAAAVGISLVRRDFGAVSFLAAALGVGEALESRFRILVGGGSHAVLVGTGAAVVSGLLSAGVVWMLTRNPFRALAILLRWYACAARLVLPLLALAGRMGNISRFCAGTPLHTIVTAGVVLYALRPVLPLSSAGGEI